MEMTPGRWDFTCDYLRETFGHEDPLLSRLMNEAKAAGLPDIAIGADVGRLLMMLTSLTRGRLAVEVGTLGGYSAIWIVRGLSAHGRLITIEADPHHADFAQRQFQRAGVQERVEPRLGLALDILPNLARELEPGSVDLVFLDAEKSEYPEYWRLVRPLIAPGGLIVADNALGSSGWWIDEVGHPTREAAHAFNRAVANDPEFDGVAIPLRQGVLIGKRM